MNKFYLTIALLLSFNISFSQQTDSLKQHNQLRYYKQKLGLPEQKAKEVDGVQGRYKSSLKTINNDPRLSDAQKRRLAAQLMAEKNKNLGTLLNSDQLDDIVPTTERRRASAQHQDKRIVTRKDTSRTLEQLNGAFAIPKDKVREVTLVQLKYKEQARQLVSDASLTTADRQAKLLALVQERNKKLKVLLTSEQLNKIISPSEQKL